MAHPFKGQAKSSSRGKFKAISGKKGLSEGDSDGSQLQPAKKHLTEVGYPMGPQSKPRPDKRARGGRTGSKVTINIISGPHGREQAGPPPLPPAPPLGVAPGPGPLPFPPGSPPPMRKSGGLVKMTGGGEGGLGRLQKAHNAKVRRGA